MLRFVPVRSAWIAVALLASGCANVHLRRLSDDDRAKRTLVLSALPACVQSVTVQLVQGAAEEAHAVALEAGAGEQRFVVPFNPGKPFAVNLWVIGVAPGCKLPLHALYRKAVPALPADQQEEIHLSWKDAKPDAPLRVPGGPVLPGEPGGPNQGDASTAEPTNALAPDPGIGTGLAVQLSDQKDAAPAAESGTAHLISDYAWQQSARGIYWMAARPKPDPKRVRGTDVVFVAETDCLDAAWYQYLQQKALFQNAANPPATLGQGYIGHDGKHEVARSAAPELDEGAPYPHQRAGGSSPAMESSPGIPVRGPTADPQDAIDLFNIVLAKGKPKFAGAQRMKMEYRFWTYLICREPYQVVGHYEWGADVSANSIRDETPFQPAGIVDPDPAPKWIPGP
jgi:hypothetical protein